MPGYFFDTSALVKFYHSELGSLRVEQLMFEPGATRFISRLGMVEMHSVFGGKVRTGTIQSADFDLYRKRFLTDVTRRTVLVARMTGFHYEEAERLLKQHGLVDSVRTLDAIQLSVAVGLGNAGLVTHFVCADKNLCKLALVRGFQVINPEQP